MTSKTVTSLSGIRNWIFDLDNTLYRGDAAFFSQIDQRMTEFVSNYLGLDRVSARKLQKDYLKQYGTTLSGMMDLHDMEPSEFLHYVHDVDLTQLEPCPKLRAAIARLAGRKFIFTNGSRAHAKNVGTYLGLFDLFDGVFAIEDTDYIPKPSYKAYAKFCDRFKINPSQSIMFEDSIKNLKSPKEMGMQTVLVTYDTDWYYEVGIDRPYANALWIDEQTDNLLTWLNQRT